MEDRYTLQFNLAGLRYLRGVLGHQPHDEVAPLIADIAAQCEKHDRSRQVVEPIEDALPSGEPAAHANGAQGAMQ